MSSILVLHKTKEQHDYRVDDVAPFRCMAKEDKHFVSEWSDDNIIKYLNAHLFCQRVLGIPRRPKDSLRISYRSLTFVSSLTNILTARRS